MRLEELKDKKIIILGFGREGQDTFFFLRKLWPKKRLALADKLDLEKLDKKAREIIKKEKKNPITCFNLNIIILNSFYS